MNVTFQSRMNENLSSLVEEFLSSKGDFAAYQDYMSTYYYVLQYNTLEVNAPRQIGKTTTMLNHFIPNRDVIITCNYMNKQWIEKELQLSRDNLKVFSRGLPSFYKWEKHSPVRVIWLDEVPLSERLFETLMPIIDKDTKIIGLGTNTISNYE